MDTDISNLTVRIQNSSENITPTNNSSTNNSQNQYDGEIKSITDKYEKILKDIEKKVSEIKVNDFGLSGILGEDRSSSMLLRMKFRKLKKRIIESIDNSVPFTFNSLDQNFNLTQIMGEDRSSSMLLRMKFRKLKKRIIESVSNSVPEKFESLDQNFNLTQIMGEDRSSSMLLRMRFRGLKKRIIDSISKSVPEKFESLDQNFNLTQIMGEDRSSSILLRMRFRGLKKRIIDSISNSVPEKFDSLDKKFNLSQILGEDESSSILLRMRFRKLKKKIIDSISNSVPEKLEILNRKFNLSQILGEDESSSILLRMRFRKLKKKIIDSISNSVPEKFDILDKKFNLSQIMGEDRSSSILLRMRFRKLKKKILDSLQNSIPEKFEKLEGNLSLILGEDNSSSILLRMKFRKLKKKILNSLENSIPSSFEKMEVNLNQILGEDKSSSILLRMKFRKLKKKILDNLIAKFESGQTTQINSNPTLTPAGTGQTKEQKVESEKRNEKIVDLLQQIADNTEGSNKKPEEKKKGGLLGLLGGLLGLAGLGAGGLTAKLAPIIKKFNKFKTFMKGPFLRILGKIAAPITIIFGVFEGLKTALDEWKNSDAESMFGRVTETIFGFIGGFIGEIGGTLMDLVKDGISWVLGKLGFEGASEFLDSFSFKESIIEFFNIIGEGFSRIADYISGIFTGETDLFGDVFNIINKLFDNFKNFFKAIGAGAKAALFNPMSPIDAFKEAFNETIEGGNEGRIETEKENLSNANSDKARGMAALNVIRSQNEEINDIDEKINEQRKLIESGDLTTGRGRRGRDRENVISDLEKQKSNIERKKNEAFETWYSEYIKNNSDMPKQLLMTKEEARYRIDKGENSQSFLNRTESYQSSQTEPKTQNRNLETKPKETGQMIYEKSQENESMKNQTQTTVQPVVTTNTSNQTTNNSVSVSNSNIPNRTDTTLQPSYG